MRAFIAIAIPAEGRAQLTRLQATLAASQADVKWVATDALHVTLKFLDEISESQRQDVEALLKRVAQSEPVFTARLGAAGAFPSIAAPRIVWVGVQDGAEAMSRMASAIEQGTAAMGLRKEEHEFSAHVTIGRVRSPRRREPLARLLQSTSWEAPPPWRVSTVTLYESVLHPDGPRYTILADIPLFI